MSGEEERNFVCLAIRCLVYTCTCVCCRLLFFPAQWLMVPFDPAAPADFGWNTTRVLLTTLTLLIYSYPCHFFLYCFCARQKGSNPPNYSVQLLSKERKKEHKMSPCFNMQQKQQMWICFMCESVCAFFFQRMSAITSFSLSHSYTCMHSINYES